MDKEIGENINMIIKMVNDIGKKHIAPYRKQWDDEQIFPRDVFSIMGEFGLMGVLVPESYNGAGMGYHE